MIIVEFREDMFNKALGQIDEAKEHLKKSKAALCDVEDLLCELYESGEDDGREEEFGDQEFGDIDVSGNEIEVNYRRRRGMRGGMRSGMSYRRSGMRRGSMGRYSY